jgi:hypothetical protein
MLIIIFSLIKFILIMLLVRSRIYLVPLSVAIYIRGDYLWFGFKIFIGRTAHNDFILRFHSVWWSFYKFYHLVTIWIIIHLLLLYFLCTFCTIIFLLLNLLKCYNLNCRVQRRVPVLFILLYLLQLLYSEIVCFIIFIWFKC